MRILHLFPFEKSRDETANRFAAYLKEYAKIFLHHNGGEDAWKIRMWSLEDILFLHDALAAETGKAEPFPFLKKSCFAQLKTENLENSKNQNFCFDNFVEYAKNLVLYAHGGLVLDAEHVMVVRGVDGALSLHSGLYRQMYEAFDSQMDVKTGMVLFSPAYRQVSVKHLVANLFESVCHDDTASPSYDTNPSPQSSLDLSVRFSENSGQRVWAKLASLSVAEERGESVLCSKKISYSRAAPLLVHAMYRDRPLSDMVILPKFYSPVKYRNSQELDTFLLDSRKNSTVFLECENWNNWFSNNSVSQGSPLHPQATHLCGEEPDTQVSSEQKTTLVQKWKHKLEKHVIFAFEKKFRKQLYLDPEFSQFPIIITTAFSLLGFLILFFLIRRLFFFS